MVRCAGFIESLEKNGKSSSRAFSFTSLDLYNEITNVNNSYIILLTTVLGLILNGKKDPYEEDWIIL